MIFLAAASRAQTVVTEIQLVSVSSAGEQANNSNDSASISGDGRFVVFTSYASNLVPGDTNNHFDVFLRDLQTGMTEIISISTSGEQGNSTSFSTIQSVSDDGRYVVFMSSASNLVPNNTNVSYDLYLRDRQTGSTERVNINLDEQPSFVINDWPAMSGDGRYIVYHSAVNNIVVGNNNDRQDIFLYDRLLDESTLVSLSSTGEQANDDSGFPRFNSDGTKVVFESTATNLVAGDTNGVTDVFIRNLQTGQTTRINMAYDGSEPEVAAYGPVISTDGRFVAYFSESDQLVPNDTNHADDVFVYDAQTAQTTRVNVSSAGQQGNADSFVNSISGDGRFVVFQSTATNLVPDDSNNKSDIFVHDRQTAVTTRVSLSAAGAQGNNDSYNGFITPNERYIVFYSRASNLVPNDTNNEADIFVVPLYPLPVSPTPTPSPPDIAPQPNYYESLPFKLTWNDVTWAVEYGIEISETSDFSTPIILSTFTSAGKLEVVVDFLDAGQYYWRVRAKNSAGVWGVWSAVESFIIDF